MSQDKLPVSPSSDESANNARRTFLKKAGKLAAYTPPTMLALMYPGMHAVASGHSSNKRQGEIREKIQALKENRVDRVQAVKDKLSDRKKARIDDRAERVKTIKDKILEKRKSRQS